MLRQKLLVITILTLFASQLHAITFNGPEEGSEFVIGHEIPISWTLGSPPTGSYYLDEVVVYFRQSTEFEWTAVTYCAGSCYSGMNVPANSWDFVNSDDAFGIKLTAFWTDGDNTTYRSVVRDGPDFFYATIDEPQISSVSNGGNWVVGEPVSVAWSIDSNTRIDGFQVFANVPGQSPVPLTGLVGRTQRSTTFSLGNLSPDATSVFVRCTWDNVAPTFNDTGNLPISVSLPAAYENIALSGPLADSNSGRSACMIDFDADGDLDLFATNYGAANVFLENLGNNVFSPQNTGSLNDSGYSRTACWSDYDNDGDLDVFFTTMNGGSNLLCRNDNGAFSNVTPSNLSGTSTDWDADWIDFDSDGLVDLILTSSTGVDLFQNSGNSQFTAMSLPTCSAAAADIASWADYDNDGDSDCYLARTWLSDNILEDSGTSTFNCLNAPSNGDEPTTVTWGDVNNDGNFDFFMGSWNEQSQLFIGDGIGGFTNIATGTILEAGGVQDATWIDFDNDGDIDLLRQRYQQHLELLENNGDATFTNVTSLVLPEYFDGRGLSVGDIDNDGDLDIFVAAEGPNALFINNNLASNQHWLQIKLEGNDTNHAAIGARIRVVAGGVVHIHEIGVGSGVSSQNSLVAHFGLGNSSQISELDVTWADGTVQDVLSDGSVAVDQRIVVEEPEDSGGGGKPGSNISLGIGHGEITGAIHKTTAFPNPFNPQVTFEYYIPQSAKVRLDIFDINGTHVKTLVDESVSGSESPYQASWNGLDNQGRPIASGAYFWKLNSGDSVESGRVIMLK